MTECFFCDPYSVDDGGDGGKYEAPLDEANEAARQVENAEKESPAEPDEEQGVDRIQLEREAVEEANQGGKRELSPFRADKVVDVNYSCQ